MTKIFSRLTTRTALKIAAAVGIGLSASGCVYDAGLGLGYASDNYAYGNGYDCDPYSPFDSYYDCDYRYGFGNIGFGGGWFNNYYYPGNGFFLFDSFGRRFNMQRDHYRYWGQRRYEWNRGQPHRNDRGREDRGHDDRDGDNRGGYPGRNGYGGNNGPHGDPAYWPGRGGGRDHNEGRDRHDRRVDNRIGGAEPGTEPGRANPGNQVSQPRMTRSGYIRRDPDGDQNRGDQDRGGQSRGDQGRYGNGGRGMPSQGAAQPIQMPPAERAEEPRAMPQSAPERIESVPRPERSERVIREPNEKDD